ncbi:MAG: UDP-N-acetylglucosamine 2-epimerase (non-hydrolyzing) [Desulfobacterales bacterium]|nr:UDP-N-acetylglucosamine 2-epimerase (non-hydrolyzing) [Desulfobacterales bacterium]
MKKLLHVVGARPNFMKMAPVHAAIADATSFSQKIIHTGQHYDERMSAIFFKQLNIPEPDINLEVGSSSHALQTAAIMEGFEKVVLDETPNLVLVYGDVNSTVAAALVCAKLQVPVAHVEAGLRSRDRTMPEEINRLITDQLSDYLFTPSKDGDDNLMKENIGSEKIFRVGNVMIDTLVRLLPQARKMDPLPELTREAYALVTLHRPSNVDDPEMLANILAALAEISKKLPLLFPVHPRTRAKMTGLGLGSEMARLNLVDPLGYLEFLSLQCRARLVITDSGGIQEETTYLGVPCLTLRENTERPVTLTEGTNVLVGSDPRRLVDEVFTILTRGPKPADIPDLWDGHAASRIAAVLAEALV